MALPEKLVISQPWGGLGENLMYSTLPERFASVGVPSYISSKNALRNPEIGHLVWDLNPFIRGVSDDEPNAGSSTAISPLLKDVSFVGRVEVAHGLEPVSCYPKLYYRPNPRPDVEHAILVDVGSVTVPHRRSGLDRYIEFVISSYAYDRHCVMQVRFSKTIAANLNDHPLPLAPFVPRSLLDYCDAIASCRAFITVHSGAQAMAIALRNEASTPTIHCYCTPTQYNKREFIFPNVEYHIADQVLAQGKHVRSLLKRIPRSLRAYIDSRT
jgi:hypothetical protein